MTMRSLVASIALFFALCAGALADGQDVIRDCTDDGRLQGSYSQAELRSALANLPSDVEEYTDCGPVIRAAQRNAASTPGGRGNGNGSDARGGGGGGGAGGSGGGGGTGGGSGATTPQDQRGSAAGDFGGFDGFQKKPLSNATAGEKRDVERSRSGAAPELETAAVAIPGSDGRTKAASSDIPLPLLVVLALLAAGVIALTVQEARRRVVARRLP